MTPPTYDRRRIQRSFKMRGLSIQSSATNALLNVLSREDPYQQPLILETIIDDIKERHSHSHQSQTSTHSSHTSLIVVTEKLISSIVAQISKNDDDVRSEAIQLLHAFRTPRITYDLMRKSFTLSPPSHQSLYGSPLDKISILSQRYALTRQRLLRQDLFQPQLIISDKSSSHTTTTQALTPVEGLLGRTGERNLLGVIIQVEDGRYYLEDDTGIVPLDLSSASILSDGFICEHSIVLVEGFMEEGLLRVDKIGLPPPERRSASLAAMGWRNADLFGAVGSDADYEMLQREEVQWGEEEMFVILSDVHLDEPRVMEKLQLLFEGFAECDPLPIFIFMGNFTSKPLAGAHDAKLVTSYYEELAQVIASVPHVASNARFVFIPGPNDPGAASNVLPRPPLPNYVTKGLRSRLGRVTMASNPCRLRFYSKEVVFFRKDVVSQLRRRCLITPRREEGGDDMTIVRHAVQTMLDQAHLCPLPLDTSPVYWQYDHALRLYPLPDAVILGDGVKQFYETYCDCDVLNPGSFSVEFKFAVYHPVVRGEDGRVMSDVEYSQV